MAFWSGETLGQKLPNLIEPFDPSAIDCAAYTLHIGCEVYVSPDREVVAPTRHTKQTLGNGEGFTIPPGSYG
jgi:dCTP deaminase